MSRSDGDAVADALVRAESISRLVLCMAAALTVPAWPALATASREATGSPDPAVTAQLQALLLDGIGFFVLGSIFLAVGLIIVLLTALRSEARDGVLVLFAIMSLLWGIRFICRAPAIRLFIGWDPAAWALFTRFLTYLIAPAAFGFVWRLFGPGWRSSIRAITWIGGAFALVASVFLLLVPDPDLLIHVFNIMIVAGMVVITVSILQPECRNHPGLRKLIVGGLGSLVFIILENLRSLGVVGIPFDVEWVGAVILYGSLGHITVSHAIDTERKLASLTQELATARQIQTSILPHHPPSVPGLAIATRHVPMTEVAGDFFDFARVDNTRFGSLIADVSGHGVPAALVAAMVKVAFQAQASQCDRPARLLAGMNEMLAHRLEGQFVTAGYACIDSGAGTIRYAGAGHPPLFLMSRRGGVEDLLPNGLIMGPFPEAQYESAERRLEPGDRILMYTDGIVEAVDDEHQEFGEQRIRDLLLANTGLSAEDFAERLLEEVKRWGGAGRKGSFADDLTLIVIDVLEPSP